MPKVDVIWSYRGDTGPLNWGNICPEFIIANTGKSQSPVDVKENELRPLTSESIQFFYPAQSFIIKRIENSVHLFPKDENSYLVYNGCIYMLQAFHAHIPSEHLLYGERFPIEWHFVHENAQSEKLVLAVWMSISDSDFVSMGQLPEHFIEVFCDFNTEREIMLDVHSFLPAEKAFYTYTGSLTTPPTIEGVTWLILKNKQLLSKTDFEKFEDTIGNTSRPVQPLNKRVISLFE